MKIEEKFGNIIAKSTQASIGSVDRALTDNLNLFNMVMEVSHVSKIPMKLDQQLVEQCSAGITDIVNARRKMVRLVDSMQRIQSASNLAETSFGCPDGFHFRDQQPAPSANLEFADNS